MYINGFKILKNKPYINSIVHMQQCEKCIKINKTQSKPKVKIYCTECKKKIEIKIVKSEKEIIVDLFL